jgi:hypothetical protein
MKNSVCTNQRMVASPFSLSLLYSSARPCLAPPISGWDALTPFSALHVGRDGAAIVPAASPI